MPDPAQSDINAVSPNILEQFVGQDECVVRVKVALEAAWADGTRFPHTLMVGPPGVGKSLMAKVIAKEMGCELREALAQTLGLGGELSALLLEAGDRDCVFLDEADEMYPYHMSLLYRSLEEGKLFVPRGESTEATRSIPLSSFTLLAATNNEFQLVQPLRERFRLILRFDYYSVEALTLLLRQRAMALHWGIEEEALSGIAGRGRGTPRVALRLLEACRRTCRSQYESVITMQHFEQTCRMEGLDEMGLDRVEQQYLRYLYEAENAVRLGTLASVLGLPPRTVSSVIEDFLVRSELVIRSDFGRQLSKKGVEHVRTSLERP
jgi:Holliday junction DNA helicase RuvB